MRSLLFSSAPPTVARGTSLQEPEQLLHFGASVPGPGLCLVVGASLLKNDFQKIVNLARMNYKNQGGLIFLPIKDFEDIAASHE